MNWRIAAAAGWSGVLASVAGIAFAARAPGSGPESSRGAVAGRPAARPAAAPTFRRDVAPIVYQNCAACHRPGEAGPFPLLTYAQVRKHAGQVALVTGRGIMPPWRADSQGEFHSVRRLSPAQVDLLRRWSEAGAPEGGGPVPASPKFRDGWRLGLPDVVFQPAESFSLGAEGPGLRRCFVMPTHFPEDRYLSAVDLLPGNRRVVRGVMIFTDTTGRGRELDARDVAPGYASSGGIGFMPSGELGAWAPGNTPNRLSDGVALHLPRGADLIIQVHYKPSGKPETDRTKIGLYFSKKPVDRRLRTFELANRQFRIPPGDPDYPVRAGIPVPTDVTLHSVTPQMRLLGREIAVDATLPDGTRKSLVRIPRWDASWPAQYVLRQPLKLPAGSTIDLVARYDNSAANPANANSLPQWVAAGENPTDETCAVSISYTVDAERLTQGIPAPARLDVMEGQRGGSGHVLYSLLLKRFDRDRDGRLNEAERVELQRYIQTLREHAPGRP